MKDVGISVLSQWTPALAKKVIKCFEKGLPVRVKGNHILNTPSGFETAFTIFKQFLPDKLKKRVRKLLVLEIIMCIRDISWYFCIE